MMNFICINSPPSSTKTFRILLGTSGIMMWSSDFKLGNIGESTTYNHSLIGHHGLKDISWIK